MTDLRRCAAMMTMGFATPHDVIYSVNDTYHDCDVHDPRVQTLEQFWCAVYTRYCSLHYSLNIGSRIGLVVRWAGVDVRLSINCPARRPYAEPMDSRVFFRLLSENSPDYVRTQMPLDWEILSPALEFGTDESGADTQPVEEPTYEELL